MQLTRRGFATLGMASGLLSLCSVPASAASQPFEITRITGDLSVPWAFGFLPSGAILITEREGRLLLMEGAQRRAVTGLPEIKAIGQGGLLDLLVPRDFASSGEIFMTFAKPQGRNEGTALMRAKLNEKEARLEQVEIIFEMSKGSGGGFHFGSRVVEAPDGHLFISIGDRGAKHKAQSLRAHNGSILRIAKDGSVPQGNPFKGSFFKRGEIWSYGHRNPQGMAFDAKGQLWAHEHGAKGGDEVNKIARGANYGWPEIAYGTDYDGSKLGTGTHQDGMEQPEFYWDPSIAPSGYMIYSGKMFPEWRGQHFIGSLKFDYIARLDGTPLREVGQIKTDQTLRIRDLREAPDGAIWFMSVGTDALYRLARP